MADSEVKAKQYEEEARKKLSGSKGVLGGLFGGASKMDEAIELFIRAGNMYKMGKKWTEAGKAFCEAADLHFNAGNKHDAANGYTDASVCFKKTDAKEAVNCLLRAIEIYTDQGKFHMAAKHHMSIAEIYENELVNIEQAIKHYEQAADYYKGEESASSANRCLLSVARYAAQLEQYQKAIDIYEEIANKSIESPLLKYAAKEHYFRAALCHMCIDLLNAQLAIKKYEEAFPGFADSRECKLLKTLMDKLEAEDADGFSEAVAEYDAVSRLDPWFTSILLRIKKSISGEADLR